MRKERYHGEFVLLLHHFFLACGGVLLLAAGALVLAGSVYAIVAGFCGCVCASVWLASVFYIGNMSIDLPPVKVLEGAERERVLARWRAENFARYRQLREKQVQTFLVQAEKEEIIVD